jgi:hypothetical protein
LRSGFITFVFLVIALQSACFLCYSFNVFGDALSYPLGNPDEMLNLTNYFDLERLGFTMLMGFGGAAIATTIVGLLTRNGQYMVYAVLIWGLCAFLPIVQFFVLSVPNTIGAIVNGLGLNSIIVSTTVDPVTGVVTEVTASSVLLVTFGLWVGVWGALYAFGLIFQRDMNV